MKATSWQISVAAEALVASLFARSSCDVSVQYGANQPEYDLVVVRGDKLMKVSVKGSQDGSWGLTQSFLQGARYHEAVDVWLKRHKSRTIFALVQFKGVGLTEMPRVYLATPYEIARRLRDTAKGRGDTILYEHHSWGPRAVAAGTIERIPPDWVFSDTRVTDMFNTTN